MATISSLLAGSCGAPLRRTSPASICRASTSRRSITGSPLPGRGRPGGHLGAALGRGCSRVLRALAVHLPSPFTADDQARGYGYDLAFRQLGIFDTRVFDRPAAGRAWFERTLPDQLTLGRPDRIAVVFAPRVPSHARAVHTKIIACGVEPSIQVHYRASKV